MHELYYRVFGWNAYSTNNLQQISDSQKSFFLGFMDSERFELKLSRLNLGLVPVEE